MAEVEDGRYSTPAPSTGSEGATVDVGRFSLNKTYITSPHGILVAASVAISLLSLIIVAASFSKGCDFLYGSNYNFFEFVTCSWFLHAGMRYFVFALSLEGYLCLKAIPWTLVEMALSSAYIILFLIADIAVAANTCTKNSYAAGAVFGFFCLICVIADLIFLIRKLRDEHPPTTNRFLITLGVQRESQQNAPPQYNPDDLGEDPSKY